MGADFWIFHFLGIFGPSYPPWFTHLSHSFSYRRVWRRCERSINPQSRNHGWLKLGQFVVTTNTFQCSDESSVEKNLLHRVCDMTLSDIPWLADRLSPIYNLVKAGQWWNPSRLCSDLVILIVPVPSFQTLFTEWKKLVPLSRYCAVNFKKMPKC